MTACTTVADEPVEVTVEPTVVEATVPPTEAPTEPKVIEEVYLETVPEATVPEETEPMVDPEEVELLACVIYQEVGGNAQCDDCRRRVADIVLNRVSDERFPNTIYDVLMQKGQYGEFYWTGVKWDERARYDCETEAVARAYRIAEEVLAGEHSEIYGEGYIWQAGFKQGSEGFWHCGVYYGK
jgi:spore germination cell wall hydrolase CwlJ-like protein